MQHFSNEGAAAVAFVRAGGQKAEIFGTPVHAAELCSLEKSHWRREFLYASGGQTPSASDKRGITSDL